MLFCAPQNISIFYVGIELCLNDSNIPMSDFAIALNRILTPALPPDRNGSKLT